MTIVIFASQTIYSFFQYRRLAEDQVQSSLLLQSHDAANDINRQLSPIALKAEQMAYYIEALPSYDTDLIVNIIRHYIVHDKLIYGSGFWLEPYIYSPSQKYHGPYVYQNASGETFLTWDYSNNDYDYHKWNWYRKALYADRFVWSEPYYDYVSGVSMITAASPIRKNGQVVGTTTVDVYISAFLDRVAKLKIGKAGYAFVLDSNGLYLGHHHEEKNLRQTIDDETDPAWHKLGDAVLGAKNDGILRLSLDGEEVFAAYTVIGDTPLHLVLIFPVAEAYAEINQILKSSITAFAVALLLFLLALLNLYRNRIELPIQALINKVHNLSFEPFSKDTADDSPNLAAPTELHQLYESFAAMEKAIRKSLLSLQESNQALTASEDRWTLALQGNNDGIWDWDITNDSIFASGRVMEIFAEPPFDATLTALQLRERIHPDDQAEVDRLLLQHFKDPSTPLSAECRIYQKDNQVRWILFRGQCHLNASGEPQRMVGSIGDITSRKKAEEALRYSQEKFSKAFYYAADVIGIVRMKDEIYLEANESFFALFGYTEKEVIGHSSSEFNLWTSSEIRSEFYRALQKAGTLRNCEVSWRTKSGHICIGLCSAEIVQIDGEACIIYAWHDITERKNMETELRLARNKLEEKVALRTQELLTANSELKTTLTKLQTTQSHLVQSERLAALANLVAGIAHEINTPIGIAVTAASHLETDTKKFNADFEKGGLKRQQLVDYLESAYESSRILNKSLNRAAHLISSFKKVSVDQASEIRRTFSVKTYLDEILLTLHPKLKKTKLNIIVNCSEELMMDSYPGAFAQIITNLVMNSIYHAYPQKNEGTLSIQIHAEAELLHLDYRDDGIGISPEVKGRIFDPFFTTNRNSGGTGLGLYILHNIVTQQFCGTISCESQLGKGTSFKIILPLVAPILESLNKESVD